MSRNDFDAQTSLLAPLYIGYRRQREQDFKEVGLALHMAGFNVPPSVVRRKVRVNGRDTKDPVQHLRGVKDCNLPSGVTADYAVRCLDEVPGHEEIAKVELWRAVAQVARNDEFAPAAPPGMTQVRLSVTSFHVSGGMLRGAPQLALMRALFVSILRNIDPNLRVTGGQHEWDQRYWTYTPATIS